MDTPRAAAAETMTALRDLGIERRIMISGDNQQVADAVAKKVGLMLEQKVHVPGKYLERGKLLMARRILAAKVSLFDSVRLHRPRD